MDGFLDKLRMANIYGSNPNFGPRPIENKYELYNKFKSDLPREQGHIRDIGQQVVAPPKMSKIDILKKKLGVTPTEGMDVVYRESPDQQKMTPFQREQLRLQEKAIDNKPKDGEITPLEKEKLRLTEKGIDTRVDIASESADIRRQDAATREMRARVYEFRANNPNAIFRSIPGGDLKAFDPRTGREIANLGPSGLLTDSEKLSIGHTNTMERDSVRHDQTRDLEGIRSDNRAVGDWQTGKMRMPDGTMKNVRINPTTNEVEEIRASGELFNQGVERNDSLSPNEQRISRFERAKRLMESDPDRWGKFLEFNDRTNTLNIKPSTDGLMGFGARSADDYQELIRILDGTQSFTLPTRTVPITNQNQLPTPQQRIVGQIYTMLNGKPGIWNGRTFNPVPGGQ